MSTGTALKFGPEWLRTLSGGGSNMNTSPPNSPSGGPPTKLPQYRYGREEMLTLWHKNMRPPQFLVENSPELLLDKPEPPILLRDICEEEQRRWQYGINSDAVLRLVGRADRGGSAERGRGRSRGIPFQKRGVYDDEFSDSRSKPSLSSMRGRSFERTQSFHDRMWGEQSGVQEEWSGPNKERSSRDNWRFSRESGAEDDWRPKPREPKSNWRYNNDWGSGKHDEGRGRSWSERDLPDWSTTDNVESVGRFDDGAFHGTDTWTSRNDSEEEVTPPRRPEKEKDKKKKPSEPPSDKRCSESESSQDENLSDEENESSHNERSSPQPQRDKVDVLINTVPQQSVQNKTQVPKLPLNIPPSKTTIQDEHMCHLVSKIVDEETEARWYYQDPQGEIQGPFKSSQMADWYGLGYFSQSLLVRKECDEQFIQLGDLAKQYGDVPFSTGSTHAPKPIPEPTAVPVPPPPLTQPASAVPTSQPDNVAQLLQQQLLQQQQEFIRQQLLQQQALFFKQQLDAQQVLLKLQQMDGWNNFSNEQKQQLIAQHLVSQQLSTPPGVGPVDPLQQLLASVGAKPAGLGVNTPLQQLLGTGIPVMPNSTPEEPLLPPPSVPGSMLKLGDTSAENHILKDPVQLMMQMHSNQLTKSLATEDSAPSPPPLTDPIQTLMRQLLQPTQQQDEASKTEERRREEERLKLEQEKLKLEEERKRFEEERKKQEELRKQEDQKRMEELLRIEEMRKHERLREEQRKAEERKMEELRRKEEMRLEEERKMEEIRRKEIEARKAKKEEERQRREEQRRLEEEEMQRQEEIKRQEMEELKREEDRIMREDQEKEKKKLEAKQAEALRRLQEQQIKAKANLPVWGASGTATSQPSLIQIQRMQQEIDAAEKQAAELAFNQQQEIALQQEILHQQQLREQQNAKTSLRWAANSSPPNQQPVKSLAEIQAEEAEELAKEQEREQEKKASNTSHLSLASAGIWGSASSKLFSSTSNAWGAPSQPQPGFWDDVPVNKPSGKGNKAAGNSKENKVTTHTRGSKNNKAIKQEEEKLNKLFQKQIQKHRDTGDEFYKWCNSMLSHWPGQVDVPTFVPFLLDVESPYEVHDYVRNYLGESKPAREFAKQFLEKRSRYRNQGSKQQVEDNILVPAPANQSLADFHEAKSKNKKGKKRMQKVDSSLLGFNVTANPERINVGERDFVEGM